MGGYPVIMPSPRRTARQSDLLQRLVALLAAEGFASFTLDELTERLRCSKTTLYQLAGSKQELVREAVKHYFREATQVIEKEVADTSAPADRVVVYLNAVARQLRPLSRRFLDDMAGFEPAREVYEANTRLAVDRMRQLIAEGVAAGAFRDVNAAFVGEVVAATMQAIQRGEVAARTGLTDAEAYAELVSLIVHAVSP
jgi:AcrR family transcriptional regulator